MDRVTDYESVGRGFESLLAYQKQDIPFGMSCFCLREGTRTIKCKSPVDFCQTPAGRRLLLSLLARDGRAWLRFLTNRFRVADILGKTVVIHADPDDFHTQPAGDSGMKVACGVIRPVRRR